MKLKLPLFQSLIVVATPISVLPDAGKLSLQASPGALQSSSTVHFYLLLALVPVVVAFAFLLLLLYRQRREANNRIEKAELEMQALRAQVNPHFIFNSLNSIRHFIHKNEPERAEHYLVKFSRLIRLILENSTQAMVNMEDDLAALELYIQIEQVRLNHAFGYKIDTTNVEVENMAIPPLIVQPLVENSIWHGLSNRAGQGLITITFSMQEGRLLCLIEDNGDEGTAAALTIPHKRKSMGMDLIRRRLEVYQHLHKRSYKITLEDRFENGTERCGKKITLSLPYELEEA